MAPRELVRLFFVLCSLLAACGAKAVAPAGMNTKFIEKFDESYSQKQSIKIVVTGVSSIDSLMSSCGYEVSYSSDDSFVKIFESREAGGVTANSVVAACVVDNCEEPGADLALLRIVESDFLNEERLLQRMQNALRSLAPVASNSDEEQKKILVLSFPTELTGPRLVDHQQRVGALLQAAWSIHQADRASIEAVLPIDSELDIAIVQDSDYMQIKAALSRAFDSSLIKSITSLFADNTNVDRLGLELMMQPLKSSSTQGIDKCKQSSAVALERAGEAVKAEGTKLKAALSAADFAAFVDNLLAKTLEVFRADVAGEVSSAVIDLAEAELRRDIFDLMFLFFRAQVQLARQDVISKFNDIAVDEIEISTDMIQLLRSTMRDSIASFRRALQQLQPHSAPNSWDIEYDVQQLRVLLSEYVNGREVQARLQGVLPRSRKPVDFSVHYFLNHPLGRDYRQDVLGKSSDTPLFDAGLSQEEPPLIPAARARAKLVTALQNGKSISTLQRMAASRDSEFAREMMMFPLSVKNPDVPLMSSRSGRRKTGPPKKDEARDRAGPERYIRYDVSPMDQVKEDLQEALRSGPAELKGDEESSGLYRALKSVPLLGPIYNHPKFNYGKKYSAKGNNK